MFYTNTTVQFLLVLIAILLVNPIPYALYLAASKVI